MYDEEDDDNYKYAINLNELIRERVFSKVKNKPRFIAVWGLKLIKIIVWMIIMIMELVLKLVIKMVLQAI